MNRPSVDVSDFAMMVIRFGVYMEQGNREQPEGRPREDYPARPRDVAIPRFHMD
jgi:hypothetical protein